MADINKLHPCGHTNNRPTRREMCDNCYQRWWFKTKKEKHEASKTRNRKNYYKYKKEMLEAYGGKCSCCGETEPVFLSLEHIQGGGNVHRRLLGSGFALWLELRELGWPKDKYTLLCHNCQRGVMAKGGCPHKKEELEYGTSGC